MEATKKYPVPSPHFHAGGELAPKRKAATATVAVRTKAILPMRLPFLTVCKRGCIDFSSENTGDYLSTARTMKSLVAYTKLRDLIISGEKLPGTRLVVNELEKELGIGKGPIREALMRLDRSGLVKNVPYKGAVVATTPTQTEIVIIFKVRMEIEAQLAAEAMRKITDEHLAELEELHSQMLTERADFYAKDRMFHSTLYAASELPHLIAIVGKLIESVETFLTLYDQERADCRKFSEEHYQILQALRERDEKKLVESISKNIRSGLDVAQRTISRLKLSGNPAFK